MKYWLAFIWWNLIALNTEADADEYHNDLPINVNKQLRNEDQIYWNQLAKGELHDAIDAAIPNTNIAKNVILFIGDGMSIPTITSSRIYVGQQQNMSGEEGLLSFESFPHVGLSKTYVVDYQVADSAASGTAYMAGVKANIRVLGLDASVSHGDCEAMTEESLLDSMVKWSQDKGKKTGVVTNTRVTHATPASSYAHIAERTWECDTSLRASLGERCPSLKDIGRQLVEDDPGRNLNLIFGGGLQCLDGTVEGTEDNPIDHSSCIRSDGKQLWKNWLEERQNEGKVAAFLRQMSDLDFVDMNVTDQIMGIFSNSHLPFDYQIREKQLEVPTIQEMTETAIEFLSKGTEGFFLMVEGGRIDHGHHMGKASVAMDEVAALHKAVQVAVENTNEEDTLIIVTADHSHTLSIAGYPTRGNPISGLVNSILGSDGVPFTTLNYANGPGFSYVVENNTVIRNNIEGFDTLDIEYQQQASVPLSIETHAGDDVPIYAMGPWSHLFHSVHEQNYIAHVMAYASCVGDYKDETHCICT